MKKFIYTILATSLILALMWAGANYKHLRSFPGIISAFYAKEFCSCYYVMERSEKSCENYARQFIAVKDLRIDEGNKSISVTGLGQSSEAVYTGKRFGCILTNK